MQSMTVFPSFGFGIEVVGKQIEGSLTSRCSTVHFQAHNNKNRLLFIYLQQREDTSAAWPQKGIQHRERSSWSESLLYLLTLLFQLNSI